MNLKELLGDKYRDDLTVEDIVNLLEPLNLVDQSTLPASVSKETFDKTASDLANYKRQLKQLREQNLTDEQKKAQEQQETAEKLRELTEKHHRSLAALSFMKAGLVDETIQKLVSNQVFASEEDVNNYVENMISVIGSIREDTKVRTKDELLKSTPKAPSGDSDKSKEFKEMTVTERMKLKAENPAQYALLSEVK